MKFEPARLLRRLAAVPELPMRVALWREYLSAAPPEMTLSAVELTLDALARRTAAGQAAFHALGQCLSAHPPARARLQAAATVAGRAQVLALLADGAPRLVAEADALRPPQFGEDRDITLGERRAWARRPDRALIDRLMLDPDPGVISNLLQNPRVVEVDVLRIVSRRPVPADVLSVVYRHPRWSKRKAVQAALAQNPYTPIELAVALVGLVDTSVLRALAREPSTHPTVRGQAKARLRRGRPPPAHASVDPPSTD